MNIFHIENTANEFSPLYYIVHIYLNTRPFNLKYRFQFFSNLEHKLSEWNIKSINSAYNPYYGYIFLHFSIFLSSVDIFQISNVNYLFAISQGSRFPRRNILIIIIRIYIQQYITVNYHLIWYPLRVASCECVGVVWRMLVDFSFL